MPDSIYYELLEIEPGATPEEVREAYRLLAMVWHPDRFPKDSKLWAHANEKMQQINEAYNALKNVASAPPPPDDSTGTTAPTHAPPKPTPNQTVDSQSSKKDHDQQVRDQEQQRATAREHAQEQQRRIDERRRQEEERRRQEVENRQSEVGEQRRAEADRLRILMREKQRVDEIKFQRTQEGLCMLCGRPLGRLDKLARRDRHRECTEFSPDPT